MKRFKSAFMAEGMVGTKAEPSYGNKRKSVGLENSGQRRECRVRQRPDHIGPCGMFGGSSFPLPFSFPSFLSSLVVYPVAKPLSYVLGFFGVSQLLGLYGRHNTFCYKLENRKGLLSQPPLQLGAGTGSTFSQSNAQAPVFKPETIATKKHEFWRIHLEFR